MVKTFSSVNGVEGYVRDNMVVATCDNDSTVDEVMFGLVTDLNLKANNKYVVYLTFSDSRVKSGQYLIDGDIYCKVYSDGRTGPFSFIK